MLLIRLGKPKTDTSQPARMVEGWAGRVLQAKKHYDAGDMDECRAAIEDANAYAV
jgi:hypothetical protein